VVQAGAEVRLATDLPIHLFDAGSGRRVEHVFAAQETVSA